MFISYAANLLFILMIAVGAVRVWTRRRHHRSAAERIARIARLELQTRVGLYFGRDWLLSRPIDVVMQYQHRIAAEGNGAVERGCWGCGKVFKPQYEHENFYTSRRNQDEAQLLDRLCATCHAAADPDLLWQQLLGQEAA